MQSGSAAHVHHEHQADMTAIAWPWGTSLRYPHNLIWHCNCSIVCNAYLFPIHSTTA